MTKRCPTITIMYYTSVNRSLAESGGITGAMDKEGSHRDAIQNMARQCGYAELTPLQQTVIPTILAGRDLVVKSGDSRGKSGAVSRK